MNCNISGEICEFPVVCPDGHLFEKALIEKYLKENGRCPISNKELKISNLTPVRGSGEGPVRPRPASSTSLAALLKLFQNEWDSIMLETFTLKKEYESNKQELCNSLYQFDASCRVIGKLIKERDEAKSALMDTQKNMATVISQTKTTKKRGKEDENNDNNKKLKTNGEEIKISQENIPIFNEITKFAKKLSKMRSQSRKTMRTAVLPLSVIEKFDQQIIINLHHAKKSGTSCVNSLLLSKMSKIAKINQPDLNINQTVNQWAIGRNNGSISFLSNLNSTPIDIKCHNGPVNHIKDLSTEHFISSGHDGYVALWNRKDKKIMTKQSHEKSITGLSAHPMQSHYATCNSGNFWDFTDITRKTILRKSDPQPNDQLALSFHPDGLILGIGTGKKVNEITTNGSKTSSITPNSLCIWDIHMKNKVASFNGHQSPIKTISFSENGYYLASGDIDGVVKLWDLRKSNEIASIKHAHEIKQVEFDPHGGYLAVVGSFGVNLYVSKSWNLVKELGNNRKFNSVSFSEDGTYFMAGLPAEDKIMMFSDKAVKLD